MQRRLRQRSSRTCKSAGMAGGTASRSATRTAPPTSSRSRQRSAGRGRDGTARPDGALASRATPTERQAEAQAERTLPLSMTRPSPPRSVRSSSKRGTARPRLYSRNRGRRRGPADLAGRGRRIPERPRMNVRRPNVSLTDPPKRIRPARGEQQRDRDWLAAGLPIPDHGHERHNAGAGADQEHWFVGRPRPEKVSAKRPAKFDRVAYLGDVVENGETSPFRRRSIASSTTLESLGAEAIE